MNNHNSSQEDTISMISNQQYVIFENESQQQLGSNYEMHDANSQIELEIDDKNRNEEKLNNRYDANQEQIQKQRKLQISRQENISSSSIGSNKSNDIDSDIDYNNHMVHDIPMNSIQIAPKAIVDEFVKLNAQSIQWQQKNSMSQAHLPNICNQQQMNGTGLNSYKQYEKADNKSILKDTFIIKGFKVFLVHAGWLNHLRKYINQLNHLYNHSINLKSNSHFNPMHENTLKNGKNQKTKNNKKNIQQKSNKEAESFENGQMKAEQLAYQFKTTCAPLTNNELLIDPGHQEGWKYLKCNQQESNLNSFPKLVGGDKQQGHIVFQKDFDVILPELHQFLLKPGNREYLNISDKYQAIQRQYEQNTQIIRTSLEINYVQLDLILDDLTSYKMQISREATVSSLKVRIFTLRDIHFKKLPASIKTKYLKNCKLNDLLIILNGKCISLDQADSDTRLFRGCLINSENVIQIQKKNHVGFNYDQTLALNRNFQCNFCRKNIIHSNNQSERHTESLVFNCCCKAVSYCSIDCQQRDNKFHKQLCNGKIESISDWISEYADAHSNMNQHLATSKRVKQDGLTGLQNLTNSCYLNCTLQCLSHCKALTNYFIQGHFIKEINTSNPLGSQGQIALAFAKVIKDLWLGDKPVVVPQNFKCILSKFKKQFSNFEQQDSQELLNIILDSLHEDLNRIKIKPLVPIIESHGENDYKASLESWQAHLKRSQSIIVDLMHGQFKSTVRCPEPDCNHLSITFEPFMNISIPIPEIKLITKQFVWVPYHIHKKCSVHSFTIKGHASIKNLRKHLTTEVLAKQDLCHDENGFEIVQIRQDKIHRIMSSNNMALGLQCQDVHLFFFEISPNVVGYNERLNQQDNSNSQNSQNNQPIEEIKSENELMKQDELVLGQRINNNYILSILNFKILDYDKNNVTESYFPRVIFFNLESSLIQVHLEIFNQLKHIFTRVLELQDESYLAQHANNSKDNKNNKALNNGSIEEKEFLSKLKMKIPANINLQKWNRMSLSEQYETVFNNQNYNAGGFSYSSEHQDMIQYSSQQCFCDPSRRKPQELPYFVRIVSRKALRMKNPNVASSSEEYENDKLLNNYSNWNNKALGINISQSDDLMMKEKRDLIRCIFCLRKRCEDCPLPFDDRLNLRTFLERSKASLQSTFYYKDDDDLNQKGTIFSKSKSCQKKAAKNSQQKQKQNPKCESKAPPRKISMNQDDLLEMANSCDQEPIGSEIDENQDFELLIQFNRNSCWGFHELLIRGQNQRQTFMRSIKVKRQQQALEDSAHKQSNKDSKPKMDQFIDKVTIADCFRQFNRPEKLSWQNEWYCDKCKQHKQAVKKIQVYKTPPILLITLKRFKGSQNNQKQNTFVYYPIEGLNMKQLMIHQPQQAPPPDPNGPQSEEADEYWRIWNDQIYDLFAVVLHTGTLNGGHYTALAKNRSSEGSSWYEFNDHQVIKLSKSEYQKKVISNHAYILFYQKRGIDFDGIQSYDDIKNVLTKFNNNSDSKIESGEVFRMERVRFPLLQPNYTEEVGEDNSVQSQQQFNQLDEQKEYEESIHLSKSNNGGHAQIKEEVNNYKGQQIHLQQVNKDNQQESQQHEYDNRLKHQEKSKKLLKIQKLNNKPMGQQMDDFDQSFNYDSYEEINHDLDCQQRVGGHQALISKTQACTINEEQVEQGDVRNHQICGHQQQAVAAPDNNHQSYKEWLRDELLKQQVKLKLKFDFERKRRIRKKPSIKKEELTKQEQNKIDELAKQSNGSVKSIINNSSKNSAKKSVISIDCEKQDHEAQNKRQNKQRIKKIVRIQLNGPEEIPGQLRQQSQQIKGRERATLKVQIPLKRRKQRSEDRNSQSAHKPNEESSCQGIDSLRSLENLLRANEKYESPKVACKNRQNLS